MAHINARQETSSGDSAMGDLASGDLVSGEFILGARPDLPVDLDELRSEVRAKYAVVALEPEAQFHFHTGRVIAERCQYDMATIDRLPASAVDSSAGVANPFLLRDIDSGSRVVDLGSGSGMDAFFAGDVVGPSGSVVGVDMTAEMLAKSRNAAAEAGIFNVEFCEGYLEDLPVQDGWADVAISNGVINLCPDKEIVLSEAYRVLKPGGYLQFADIANGVEVPEAAKREIDLWTG